MTVPRVLENSKKGKKKKKPSTPRVKSLLLYDFGNSSVKIQTVTIRKNAPRYIGTLPHL